MTKTIVKKVVRTMRVGTRWRSNLPSGQAKTEQAPPIIKTVSGFSKQPREALLHTTCFGPQA